MKILDGILFLLLLICPLPGFAQDADSVSRETFYRIIASGGVDYNSQNWVKDTLSFPAGKYYSFYGKLDTQNGQKIYTDLNINNPEIVIGYLFGRGIHIKEAWWKMYENSCGDGEVRAQVIVPSFFIFRTDSEARADILEPLGFRKVSTPSTPEGGCDYSVRHYVFK